ncbi:hypothetical protein QL285_068727 [Trifolium repens]|jgi:hypothetical protein|nr:hypothetical protein QL285_068727 [Trifolium repens]
MHGYRQTFVRPQDVPPNVVLFDKELRTMVENIVVGVDLFLGDIQWRLASLVVKLPTNAFEMISHPLDKLDDQKVKVNISLHHLDT